MERFSNIFGEGVDMIVTPDATTRLVVDGQDHEVLTAWSNHPYCNRAEVYTSRIYQRFLDREATRRPDERNLSGEIYEDVSVLINLRNCATLEVSRHRFTATIFRKLYGGRGLVSTGVTIAPGPIAGLLCAPHDESCQEWTVARPYMPGLAKHSSKKDPEKAIGPAHIHRLARPRCAYDSRAWSVTTDWPQPKVDFRSLSPRDVLTLEELLDCTLKTNLSWYRQ